MKQQELHQLYQQYNISTSASAIRITVTQRKNVPLLSPVVTTAGTSRPSTRMKMNHYCHPERNFALANKEKPATQRSADKKTGFRVVVTKEKLHFSGHIAK